MSNILYKFKLAFRQSSPAVVGEFKSLGGPRPDRVGRLEYAAKSLILLGLGALAFLCIPPQTDLCPTAMRVLLILASVLLLLYLFVKWMFLSARRLHDFGRTGWWIFVYVVFQNVARTLVAAVPEGLAHNVLSGVETSVELGMFFLLLLWPGNRGCNEYGDPPEYPKTLPGRLGLVGYDRRRVLAIVIWTLAVLTTSALCRFFPTKQPAQAEESGVGHPVTPMPQSEIGRVLDGLTVMSYDYSSVRDQLAGQSLTITNAPVRICSDLGNGWSELFVVRQATNGAIIVLAYVPTERLDAYASDPLPDDRVLRLTGRVITRDMFMLGPGKGLDARALNSCPSADNAIWLDDVQELDVTWKDRPRPTVDVQTISGDDFVRLADSWNEKGRESTCARLLGPALGRALTFSACKITEVELKWNLHVTLAVLHPDTGGCVFRFSVPLREERAKTWARNLSVGSKVTNVCATVCKKDDYEYLQGRCTAKIWMTDLTCEKAGDIGSLPVFDAATIGGDALIELLSAKMKRSLTLEEVEDLERRLDGREMSFSSADIQGCGFVQDDSGKRVVAVTVGFPQTHLGFSFQVKLDKPVSKSFLGQRRVITGKVVAPSRWVEDRDAGQFVIHMVNGRWN